MLTYTKVVTEEVKVGKSHWWFLIVTFYRDAFIFSSCKTWVPMEQHIIDTNAGKQLS
jgi:hypothetical protein